MDLSAIALQGLEQARLNSRTPPLGWRVRGRTLPTAPAVDSVDLSAEIVALMSAKTQFSANLSTLKTANQIQKSGLDVMA